MNKTRANDHLPEIDGLRAIAVLAVVAYHTDKLPFFQGGFIGVDIFFVISGYVIARSIYNRPLARFDHYLFGFYQRRIKRIVPALLVVLMATTLASTLFIPSAWLSDTIDKTGLADNSRCKYSDYPSGEGQEKLDATLGEVGGHGAGGANLDRVAASGTKGS